MNSKILIISLLNLQDSDRVVVVFCSINATGVQDVETSYLEDLAAGCQRNLWEICRWTSVGNYTWMRWKFRLVDGESTSSFQIFEVHVSLANINIAILQRVLRLLTAILFASGAVGTTVSPRTSAKFAQRLPFCTSPFFFIFSNFISDRNPHVYRLAYLSTSRPAGRKTRSGP